MVHLITQQVLGNPASWHMVCFWLVLISDARQKLVSDRGVELLWWWSADCGNRKNGDQAVTWDSALKWKSCFNKYLFSYIDQFPVLLTLLGTTGPLCILTDSASRNICGLDSIKQLLAETSKKISSSLTLSLTQVHSPSLVGHMKDLGRLIGQKEKAVAAPWNGSHISNINCHPWDPLVLMSCWHSGLTVSWSLPS